MFPPISAAISWTGLWSTPRAVVCPLKAYEIALYLLNHKAVVCTLAVAKPSRRRRLVTSRNIKAICPSDFQCDVRALVEAASHQCSDSDLVHLVDVCNDGLCRLLDRHAPSVTRGVRGRPSAPWTTEEIRERDSSHSSQRNLRQGASGCKGVCSGSQETVLL